MTCISDITSLIFARKTACTSLNAENLARLSPTKSCRDTDRVSWEVKKTNIRS